MNEINDGKLQTGYKLCSEEWKKSSDLDRYLQEHKAENGCDSHVDKHFVVVQEFQDDENSNMSETEEIGSNQIIDKCPHKKHRKFKRIRNFFRRMRGVPSDSIDTNFPTYLDSQEMREYNEELRENNDRIPTQTETTLTASPHYVHHIEMDEKKFTYLLARRSCHLPGNNWWQDWVQFIFNNHPLFGICLHHRLHPVGLKSRIYILIASISFGVVATNAVYLYFVMFDEDFEQDIIKLNLQITDGFTAEAGLTSGIAMLLIFNGILHVSFDVCMWHIAAASCCHNLKNYRVIKKYGSHAIIAISGLLLSLASFIFMFRISWNLNEQNLDNWEDIAKLETLLVILAYFLQLTSVYFIINPIFSTVMFSGVLGCLPFMGGRPAHIERELRSIVNERIKYYREDGVVSTRVTNDIDCYEII